MVLYNWVILHDCDFNNKLEIKTNFKHKLTHLKTSIFVVTLCFWIHTFVNQRFSSF